MPTPPPLCGRLAPSPTGLLHLGNAWAFLLAWLSARSQGGRLLLRLEDIDPVRCREEYSQKILEDLAWLGLTWDGAPLRQSERSHVYEEALNKLQAQGRVYPCFCSRKDLRSLASAPHGGAEIGDAGVPYPGTCRNLAPELVKERLAKGQKAALRLRCPDLRLNFLDLVQGPQESSALDTGGDFALRRSDAVWAYQLATALDDAQSGITQVVRGRDILASTPRQILILRLLDLPAPEYAHIPLLLDTRGERLAKRHQSLSLQSLKTRGVRPQAIIGLLGKLAGLNPAGLPCTPAELIPAFDYARLPREDLCCDEKFFAALA